MRSRLAIGAVALALLLGAVRPATAGTLCGTVRDAATNAPLSHAGVFVRTPAGALTGYSTGTADDGTFCLASIPAGTYDLEVRRDDYQVAYLRGVVVTGGDVDVSVLAGAGVELAAPFPNPASASAHIGWTMPASGPLRLRILDVAGHLVREWAGDASAGSGALVWDLRDAAGGAVPRGVYCIVLDAASARRSRILIRVR